MTRSLSTAAFVAAAMLGSCQCGVTPGQDAGVDGGVDAGVDGGVDAGADAGVDAGLDGGADGGLASLGIWPNEQSNANSDPWLALHHDEIRVLRPKVLALNFVNAKTNAQMQADLDVLITAFREGSRYHAYRDAGFAPMLEYQIAKAVDLRDTSVPPAYPYRNSTLYPREAPVSGYWGFDYAKLWSREFAAYYGYRNPANGEWMDLCELVNAGLVHEVWVYGDADVPDVNAAEILELKPRYDSARQRLSGAMDPCAGNGCFDAEDVATLPAYCTRALRIGWVNNTRGPGCYMESWGHGLESTANRGLIPYLTTYFRRFGGFDLDTRYGLPWNSWYVCSAADCLSYPNETTVTYSTSQGSGTLSGYVPTCGNAHFAPNSRAHYDDQSPYTVRSTCEHFAWHDLPDGGDSSELFTTAKFRPYDAIAGDCSGAWKVYWMQSMPGRGSPARSDDGAPMLSWLPFLFY